MPASQGDIKRVHIRVTGRVQGVGFRAYVADQFRVYGVMGWVRNVGYDQVEALAEGAETALKAFAEAVVAARAPPASTNRRWTGSRPRGNSPKCPCAPAGKIQRGKNRSSVKVTNTLKLNNNFPKVPGKQQ
jgi:acylphosphatase